jgi:polyphosphate kinase
MPGVSENITVTSVVGRFLEHPRIFYFRNGGDDEVLMGSADLMPRNLDRRVETLFPIEDSRLRNALRDHILNVHLKDNVQSRRLLPDGSYEWVYPQDGEPEVNSQLWMVENRGIWNGDE